MIPELVLLLALLDDVLPATPSLDTARLERAAALLGLAARESSLGPWRLFTDVADRPLLAHLDRVAALLPESYRARSVSTPSPVGATAEEARPTVVHELAHLLTQEDLRASRSAVVRGGPFGRSRMVPRGRARPASPRGAWTL